MYSFLRSLCPLHFRCWGPKNLVGYNCLHSPLPCLCSPFPLHYVVIKEFVVAGGGDPKTWCKITIVLFINPPLYFRRWWGPKNLVGYNYLHSPSLCCNQRFHGHRWWGPLNLVYNYLCPPPPSLCCNQRFCGRSWWGPQNICPFHFRRWCRPKKLVEYNYLCSPSFQEVVGRISWPQEP